MLKTLRVKGFKSLLDTEVHLAPLVVLFGPNASGKSNFLEALLLLSRLVTERTASAALGPPIRGYPLEAFSMPRGGLAGLLGRQHVDLSIEVDVAANEEHDLRYRVDVQATPASGEVAVVDEYLASLKKDGTVKGHPLVQRDDHRLVVRRPKQGRPREERGPLNHTVLSNLQYSGEGYDILDLFRREVEGWRSYYLDPAVAMRDAQPPRDVRDIGPNGQYLAPYLFRLKGSPQTEKSFVAIRRALQAAISSVESLDVDLDRERGTLDIRVRQHDTEYSARVLSEGTLRVLALCAIAANPWPSSLVAFEEPENGVHPRRIEVVASLLWSLAESGRRQVIVTTHSPTFIAEMLQRSRKTPGVLQLLRCRQQDSATQIVPFGDPAPLFDDHDIKAGLASPEDAERLEALFRRGWLDG